MADALSIAASVIAVATVFLQSSKALTELVQDVKGAPEELKAIANDANAFSAQVLAVKASLADAEIARLVDRTEVIRGLMANMRDAMQNCADACQSLLLKLGSHATLTMTGLSIARDLGWMFKKKDILAAVQRLANTKLSLTASYSSATLVMQMHSAVLASGNAATVQINPAKITGAGINVASTLGQYAASLAATPDSISGRSYRLAIDAGDVDLVERMLDQGIGIDTVLDEGHTALLQAVVNKDLTMMQLLLNRGASPHAIWMYTTVVTNYDVQVEEEDQQKDTVLHLAIRAWQSADECHAMVLTLVQSGADVNATNANGDAPLNLLLREAAGQQGCDKVVRVLIEHGASLDWRNNAGDTLLSSTLCGQYPWGELDKRIDLVGLLLDSGASPRALTYNGATLLHEMIEDRRLVPGGPLATRDRRTSFDRLMDMLLFHGFDAVSLDLQGRPILAAIIMGGVLDWFDIFNRYILGATARLQPGPALTRAIAEHDGEGIICQLGRSRNDKTSEVENGVAGVLEAVCWAVALQDEALVVTLLGPRPSALGSRMHSHIVNFRADTDGHDSRGSSSKKPETVCPLFSPLTVAARTGERSMVRLLLSYGLAVVHHPDSLDVTALDTALHWRNLAAIQEIMKFGVIENSRCIVPWRTIGIAIRRAPMSYIDALLFASPQTGGSIPDQVFEDYLTSEWRHSHRNDEIGDIMYCFAEHGFSPLTRFGDGRTLLHNTIVEELRETLMALAYSINCPGYVDVRDHKGQTACGLAGRMYREGWHDNFGAMLTAGGRRTIGTALSMLDIDQAKDEELAQALGLTVIENNVSTGAWSMGALGLSNELSWRKFTDPYSEPGLLQMPEAWRQASGYLSKYQRDHFNALPRFASTAPNPLKIRRTQDDILHLVAKASAEKKRLTATYKGHGDVNPDGLHRRVQITNHIFARKPDMATWSPSGEPTCLNRFSLREGLERHWAASEWCQLYFERYVNVDWKAIAAQPEYQKIRELVMRDQKLVDAMSRVPVR